MKYFEPQFYQKISAFLLSAMITISFSACKSRTEWELDKARRQAQVTETVTQEVEAEHYDKAHQDFNDRIAQFNAISGVYTGNYENAYKKTTGIEIILTTAAPLNINEKRHAKESEMLEKLKALSFYADVVHFNQNENGTREIIDFTQCHQTGVQPDLDKGLIIIKCPIDASQTINYYVYFDENLKSNDLDTNIEEIAENSSSLLLQNKVRIQALNLRIYAPFAIFSGRVSKVNENKSLILNTGRIKNRKK